MHKAWSESPSKNSTLIVELAIADFANDDGLAFPSIETLSKKARLSVRQTQRAIRQLQRTGQLQILVGQGPHGTNLYRVTSCQGDKLSGVTSVTQGGDIHDVGGVTPVTPNPSEENHHEPSDMTPEALAAKWNKIPGIKPVTFKGRLHETIRKIVLARIKEHPTVDWWEGYFQRVTGSDFLTGKVPGNHGKPPFVATFDWALGPVNMGKILSGSYDNHYNTITAAPQSKCVGMNGEPCTEYVAPPSKTYCPKCKAANDARLAKMTVNGHVGTVPAQNELMEAST